MARRCQPPQAGRGTQARLPEPASTRKFAVRPLIPPPARDDLHRLGRFTLRRFLPSFRLHDESHLGELIVDDSGRVAYLKSYRLSQGQIRRGHLLTRLAACDGNLAEAARALCTDAEGLALRLDRAGFGYLPRRDVLDHYRATARHDPTKQEPTKATR